MISCPNSLIFDLCKHRDWRRVELECKREPLNAAYNVGDDIGSLPLHVACKKQPTSRVIRSLLIAYPKAARTHDANGYLPLHIACLSNASLEVLQLLTDNDPETASLFNAAGESTLAILSRARDSTESNVDFHNPALWESESAETQEIIYTTLYWQKVQVLIEAIAIHRQSNTLQCIDDLFTMHAAVSLSWCPADVLHFCCYKFPEQVQMIDECGRLPLHLVVRRTAYYKSNETLAGKLQIREKSIIIPRLLHLYPEAAQRMDPHEPMGRYPLHTSLINKHEWYGGVKELYQHHPEATLTLDPVENLYPFQLASFDLDTVFQLLRNAPSALKNASSNLQSNIVKTVHEVLPILVDGTTFHSPPQRSPHKREKRRKHVETSLRAELESLVFPVFDDKQHSGSKTKVSKNPSSAHKDIFFSIDDADNNMYKKNVVEVIWEPPPSEQGRQRKKLEKVHSILEIVIPGKRLHASTRRKAKSSVMPPITVDESEYYPDEAPALVEETDHSGTTSSDISGESFPGEKAIASIYAEMLRYDPSEQSVDTRLMQNLNFDVLSTCSQTETDESSASNNVTYNKYKCMISGAAQTDKYAHEWSNDIVSRNVRKLYKQPTVEVFNCSF